MYKIVMNDSDIRRQRLKELVDRMGLTAAANYLGKPVRQVNDMIAERKSFGAKVARGMEVEAGLPRFYFDSLEAPQAEAIHPPGSKVSEQPLEVDEFKRQLNFFYDGMSQVHREAILNMANTLYSADNPEDRKANPWSGSERRKAQVLPLGELIEVTEGRDADNNPNHRVPEQGADKAPRRVVRTSKKG